MGLSHLDAEGVILPSSAYKGTPEGKSATKKSHKMKISAENSADINLFKVKKLNFKAIFNQHYYRDFCSALNGTAPSS